MAALQKCQLWFPRCCFQTASCFTHWATFPDLAGPSYTVPATCQAVEVFLCDSGSVSVEVAIKMSLQYWALLLGAIVTLTLSTGAPLGNPFCLDHQNGEFNNFAKFVAQFWVSSFLSSEDLPRQGKTSKTRIATVQRGYHGDTFGAMSVCDPVRGMHTLFKETLAQQLFADPPALCTDPWPWWDKDMSAVKPWDFCWLSFRQFIISANYQVLQNQPFGGGSITKATFSRP